MSRVGSKINEFRLKSKISAKQFAKKIGVAETYVLDVENGKKIITEDLIKKIERAYNISLSDDVFEEINEPLENIREDSISKNVNKQWEEAFSNVLKKIPLCNLSFKEIYDYKFLPVIDRKVLGFNPEKVTYISAPDDSMRGFRILKGDSLLLFLNGEIVNGSISLIEVAGKRYIRQLKRLDSNKILAISNFNEIKTETLDVKELTVVGRCVRLEIEL